MIHQRATFDPEHNKALRPIKVWAYDKEAGNEQAAQLFSTHGNHARTDCPQGKYAHKDSAISCFDCPAGKFSSGGGGTHETKTTLPFGSEFIAACTKCPMGWWSLGGEASCPFPGSWRPGFQAHKTAALIRANGGRPLPTPDTATPAPTPIPGEHMEARYNDTVHFRGSPTLAPTAKPIRCAPGKFLWTSGVTGLVYCEECAEGTTSDYEDSTACHAKTDNSTTAAPASYVQQNGKKPEQWRWNDETAGAVSFRPRTHFANGTAGDVAFELHVNESKFNNRGMYLPPKLVHYSPRTSKVCCENRCRDHVDVEFEDCKEGCEMWLQFSSLNWESHDMWSKLEQKCWKDCSMPALWQKHQNIEGHEQNSEYYWKKHGVVDESMCNQGCSHYFSCMHANTPY
jgi:hypothetical protein